MNPRSLSQGKHREDQTDIAPQGSQWDETSVVPMNVTNPKPAVSRRPPGPVLKDDACESFLRAVGPSMV